MDGWSFNVNHSGIGLDGNGDSASHSFRRGGGHILAFLAMRTIVSTSIRRRTKYRLQLLSFSSLM